MPKALKDAAYVLIRVDKVRKPLDSPYEGPFKVLERSQRTFRLNLGEHEDWVSIDRLKPAFLDDKDPPPTVVKRKRGRPKKISSS